MEQYIKERWVDYSWAKQPVNKNSTIKLSDAVWNEYRIGDLFKVTYGKFIKDNKCGTVKYITATAKNNGFGGMVNGEPMYSGNCITIASDGSIGSTFYQGEPFSASNIVVTLEPIGETMLNDYIAMFICTLIREESSKYSYGRKYSVERVRNTILRLPSTPEGTPDYEFMEEYIKSLPYSIVLDKVPDNN